jgi:hypothetical protein
VTPQVTVLDVSDHRPRRVPSKTWRELIKKIWNDLKRAGCAELRSAFIPHLPSSIKTYYEKMIHSDMDVGLAAKTRPVVIVSRYDPDPPRDLILYVPPTTGKHISQQFSPSEISTTANTSDENMFLAAPKGCATQKLPEANCS